MTDILCSRLGVSMNSLHRPFSEYSHQRTKKVTLLKRVKTDASAGLHICLRATCDLDLCKVSKGNMNMYSASSQTASNALLLHVLLH